MKPEDSPTFKVSSRNGFGRHRPNASASCLAAVRPTLPVLAFAGMLLTPVLAGRRRPRGAPQSTLFICISGPALAFARAFAADALTFSQSVGSRAHPVRLADLGQGRRPSNRASRRLTQQTRPGRRIRVSPLLLLRLPVPVMAHYRRENFLLSLLGSNPSLDLGPLAGFQILIVLEEV